MIRYFALALVTLISFTAIESAAQPPSDAERAAARELGYEALKSYKNGDFVAALDGFERSHQIMSLPTTGLWLARTLVKSGRLIEASERYLEVIQSSHAASGNKKFVKAIEDARTEREKLQPRIPRLRIILKGDDTDGTKVTVDGRPILAVLLGVSKPTDPGPHTVVAKKGDRVVEKKFTLNEGARHELELELPAASGDAPTTPTPVEAMPTKVAPVEPSPPPATTTGAPPASTTEDEGSGLRTGAWVSFGVAGLGAIGAGVLTGLTLQLDGDLRENCDDSGSGGFACPPQFEDDIGSYNTMRALAIGSGALAGVALGTGITLLIVSGSDDKATEETATWRIQPWIGPRSIGLNGQF